MPPVTRLGDICTGHESWPPRGNDQASGDVYVNSIGAHRQTDHWPIHCSDSNCHDSTHASGSATVFVNDKQLSRIGDPINCGSYVAQGSPNVFAGG
jgi:uncharacterized Zn-binding protein involved in type VI secretion